MSLYYGALARIKEQVFLKGPQHKYLIFFPDTQNHNFLNINTQKLSFLFPIKQCSNDVNASFM